MNHEGTDVAVLVSFDDDGWPFHVECTRPRTVPSGKAVSTPWKGYFYHFQKTRAGFFAPKHMECGWILDDKEELYFKGDNLDLAYELSPAVVVATKDTGAVDK